MQTEPISQRLEQAALTLRSHGQDHLLHGLDSLDDSELSAFIDQLMAVDYQEIDGLAKGIGVHGSDADSQGQPETLQPAPFVARNSTEALQYRSAGEELIRQGKVAAFTVAGGQGTRLGWKGPKGTFPATPITEKPLFQVFAEGITAAEKHYGTEIPWYVMTSPINDADTREFFSSNAWFGKSPDLVTLFPQGVMPAVDPKGRMLLEAPGRLALSPDGHGGSLRALRRSGALADMQSRGVTTISYFQVDNPSVHVIDPVFLGLHAAAPGSSAEMSSKMVPKLNHAEKVGVFCQAGEGICVIEYSDLDPKLATKVDDQGKLSYISGSIALHILGVDFVDRLTAEDSGIQLPFHRAHKKVPCWDPDSGVRIEPTEPNAVKFEMFVFDALAMASRSIVLETDRVEEFAPIKNAHGTDSADSSKALQIQRATRWIESAGGNVPRTAEGGIDAVLEIQASTAVEALDLQGRDLPTIPPGSSIVL